MFQVIILSEAKGGLSDVQALSPEASQMKWLVQDCNEARGVCVFHEQGGVWYESSLNSATVGPVTDLYDMGLSICSIEASTVPS